MIFMKLIPRPEYLKFLNNWKDRPLIKVVSGVRRCGKSTLFMLLQDELKEQGIKESNIIKINLKLSNFMYK